MQGRHTYNFCLSKGFYVGYTFCTLSIYLSERMYFMLKMAQSDIHKTSLNLTVDSCSQMIQSSESSFLFNCKCFFVSGLKYPFLFDDELMTGDILTKWHALIQSFLGFLWHRSAPLVNFTMSISWPQTFPASGWKFWRNYH